MSATSTVQKVQNSYPGYQYINGLLSGSDWANPNITFSFPQSGSLYETPYTQDDEPRKGFVAFNSVQQTAVRIALGMYATVANVTFTEVTETATNHGQFRFGFTGLPSDAEG